MKSTATLTNYRQSPRKVRVVGELVKGKTVSNALISLDLLPKRASLPIRKLILSALANAKGQGESELEGLIVKNITIDKGVVLHRWLPKARGRATPLRKKCSHVTVTLVSRDEIGKKNKKVSEAKHVVAEKKPRPQKEELSEEKKTVAKKTTTKKASTAKSKSTK
ncbi:MAG: 50S ribosomal protein L22 [Candidatus Paceibacterota bacterium]